MAVAVAEHPASAEQEYCINCRRPVNEYDENVILTCDGHLACCVKSADAYCDFINMTRWC